MAINKPYGGKLVDRALHNGRVPEFQARIDTDRDILLNIELIATGAFSPLEGFMRQEELFSCTEKTQLPNGLPWSVPILLSVPKEKALELKGLKAERAGLFFDGKLQAIMDVEETFKFDKKQIAKKIFGTTDLSHPGVSKLCSLDDFFVGGKITQISSFEHEPSDCHFTPKQTREIFKKKGWETIAAFHTRNVPHRGHENLQRRALEICDGLMIQPIIGWRKPGDFSPEAIVRAYKQLIENYYPKNRVLLSTLSTTMFYAGPKDVIFHAIVRKNFGCTHFIVGRDHAGVKSAFGKDFYKIDEACRMLETMAESVGIEPISIDTVYYFHKEKDIVLEEGAVPEEEKEHFQKISGTTVRNLLMEGKPMSPGLIRPEVAGVLSKEDLI
ncbi:MAG: sulfate adenylyltransferase [archaeon]